MWRNEFLKQQLGGWSLKRKRRPDEGILGIRKKNLSARRRSVTFRLSSVVMTTSGRGYVYYWPERSRSVRFWFTVLADSSGTTAPPSGDFTCPETRPKSVQVHVRPGVIELGLRSVYTQIVGASFSGRTNWWSLRCCRSFCLGPNCEPDDSSVLQTWSRSGSGLFSDRSNLCCCLCLAALLFFQTEN